MKNSHFKQLPIIYAISGSGDMKLAAKKYFLLKNLKVVTSGAIGTISNKEHIHGKSSQKFSLLKICTIIHFRGLYPPH